MSRVLATQLPSGPNVSKASPCLAQPQRVSWRWSRSTRRLVRDVIHVNFSVFLAWCRECGHTVIARIRSACTTQIRSVCRSVLGSQDMPGGQTFRFPFLSLLCFKETDDGVSNRKDKQK